MKLLKSSHLEEYVKNNKKLAESEFPYIIGRLLKNTVDGINGFDIPSGDNVIQIGFDGVIKFTGTNKYLGDKPVNIEIGTDADYISKANTDIKKRIPRKDQNFVFITPFRWNSRKKSKNDWILEKKALYDWNDIKIIDGSVLEDWIEEDISTTKYILNKINIDLNDIRTIDELEKQFSLKTKRNLDLNFFDYDDKGYEKLLSELKKDFYNVVASTREEGLFVTLFYLRKLKKTDEVLIINSYSAWQNIVINQISNNNILIPNFYHEDGLEVPKNNITIFIHDREELIKKSDYSIEQRTINNLHKALESYYKDDKQHIEYDEINTIIRKSLGRYIPLKRELFKEFIEPKWYKKENIKLYLYLFFINDFKTKDLKIFEEFNVDLDELQKMLNELVKEKDPYIVYYKYWDEYKVVDIYNVIEWLGPFIDEMSIDNLCKVARKVLFYLEPKYLPENIGKQYYVEKTAIREYSKVVKNGLLKGLIITKLFLQRENKVTLIKKLDDLIDQYYSIITTEGMFLSFANLADKLVEFNYEKFLKKVRDSLGNKEFEKMFDLTNKDIIFSSNEYCRIIFAIEKAIHKKDYIVDAIETLALLSEMNNANYKNMGNTPFNTLRDVFIGWDNLTCLDMNEKIVLLQQLINNHYELGKKLMKSLLPSRGGTWSPLQKPEFDVFDDVKPIKFVKEQKDYFEKYYLLYLNNYVNTLDDLVCIYEETYFIDFECFAAIKEKTIHLIANSSDEEKYKLKEEISEKLRGYEKFHNSAWNLSSSELEYYTFIKEQLVYENPIYDYVFLYQWHIFLDDVDISDLRVRAISLLNDNDNNEDLLLEKCDNKNALICDIYKYKHNCHHNIDFLKKLFDKYGDYVTSYLRMIYLNETVEEVISVFNSDKLNYLSLEKRIIILSHMGFNNLAYNEIKDSEAESYYWNKLNMFDGERNDFVYKLCLKYGNFDFCLDMLYEKADMYDEKCELLEKIRDSKVKASKLDEYKIEKIFESFYNYTKIDNFERLSKLEIYFGPILQNSTYFLSKEANKYPSIVAELVEIVYKDEDGNSSDYVEMETVVSTCFEKLHNLEIDFNNIDAFKWCDEFLELMKEKKRSQVMFHVLGQLLARTNNDKEDGMFPSKIVRKVIEHYKSDDLASSFKIEKYNQRGMHFIGIGEEEYSLYKKYSDWSNKMKIEYPKTSKILKDLAETYKNESFAIRDEANYVR